MATKKAVPAKEAKKEVSQEQLAKKAARKEALKNRPAGQRPNSKQIDVIADGKSVVKTYGYPIRKKLGHGYAGVVVTSVVFEDGKAVAVSSTFVPGNHTVKAKKGHGTIIPYKKGDEELPEADAAEDEDEEDED